MLDRCLGNRNHTHFATIANPADHVRAPMVFNPLFANAGLTM